MPPGNMALGHTGETKHTRISLLILLIRLQGEGSGCFTPGNRSPYPTVQAVGWASGVV